MHHFLLSLRISVIISSFLFKQCGMFLRGVIEEIYIQSYSFFGLSFWFSAAWLHFVSFLQPELPVISIDSVYFLVLCIIFCLA